MDTITWRDLLTIGAMIVGIAASHFRLAGRIAVLESETRDTATHSDLRALTVRLDAHQEMFRRIEESLKRIDDKLERLNERSSH